MLRWILIELGKLLERRSKCHYGMKKNKPWFDKGYSDLLDQRK
jgi:hypothetical protein